MKKIAFFMAVSLMLFVFLPTLGVARTDIDSDVTSNTTWDISGSPYVISGNIFVESGVTLTINPNVVVKFAQYGGMNIYGTLVADGGPGPGEQIYFTSIKDDAVGGDTNDDGDTSSPAPGDWYYLYFYGADPGNLLDNVVVRYGGSGSGSVYINTSAPMTVSNSVIEQGLYYGIYLYNAADVTLTGNTISNNGQYGIYGYGVNSALNVTNNTISGHTTGAIHLDVNSLLNSTISDNTLIDNVLDTIVIGGSLSTNATWSPSYGTYVVDSLTVADSATLTIEPGTVVKFAQYGGMNIYGTLVADGGPGPGEQIYFTSIKDDAVGGDTNDDGDTSSPAPGDWYYLYFYGADPGNLLDNVVVRYGGSGSGSVYINTSAPMTVSNSVIEQGLYYGIYLYNAADVTLTGNTISNNGQYGIYGYGVNSALNVTNNTISGHTTGAIHLDVNSLLNSTISDNTLIDNVLDTIVIGGSLSTNATWSPSYGTYVVDSLTVADSATLTIEPGTVVKFAQYGWMNIYGTLVADGGPGPGEQIYFTSIKDDAVGGDTNDDGDTSSPAPGDWYYLYFYGADPGNLLDNVVVRYGGSGSGSVYINTSAPMTVSNSVIEQGLYYGIYLYNAADVTLTGNTISNNGQYGIYGYGVNSALNVTNNTISGHTTGAIHLDVNSLLNSTISDNTLIDNVLDTIVIGGSLSTNATWSPSYGTYVVDSLTVADSATLTIEPGTVVKFTQYGGMNIYGTLVADGGPGPGEQIYFTSIKDDAVGGDTNDDGDTSSPAPGDWYYLYFYGADPGNLLDNVVVRYGGGTGSLYINTSSPMTVSNSVIEQGLYYGIYLYYAADVTLTGNTILGNGSIGMYLNNSTGVTIIKNLFQNNGQYGIYCDYGSDPIIGGSEADANAFDGHTMYGVFNADPSITVNAISNYWGHSSGPSGFGPGTGDSVSDYVDFDPWIGASPFDLAPTVIDIPDQTTDEGGTFVDINLDDYVSDSDNADDEISWTYSGNTDLTVNIVNRVAAIDIPGNWTGAETITFTATDPGGLSDAESATFTVNDTGLGESSACDDDAECSSGNCVNAVTAPWYPANIGACCSLGEFWAVDHCEPCVESDGDEVCDSLDNCPAVFNADQADADSNGVGDICDAVSDTDGDGLSDADEVNLHGTDPANPDSDGDWVGDGIEINNNTNPNNPDEFTPPGTGAIRGTVNDSGGLPITTNNIRVQVITGDPCGGWQQVGDVITSDGNYIFVGLDHTQDYWVRTDNMWQSNYVNEWYASSSSIECTGAQLVDVPENGSADNIDFQLDLGVEISGTVFKEDGITEINDAWINVTAYRAGGPCQVYTWSVGTQTNMTDGSFTLKGVPVGTDSVYLSTNNMNQSNHMNEWWRNITVGSTSDCNLAELLDVPGGGVSDLSFQLDLGGSVSGYVFDASDNPIENLWVRVNEDLCGGGQWSGGYSTDGSGYYKIWGIPASTDVYVQACADCSGLDWVDEWWDGDINSGSIDCNGAEPISILPDIDSGGISFKLAAGGSIAGHIEDILGDPIINLHIWAQEYDTGQHMGGVNTNDLGNYTIGGLPSGDYRLRTCSDCSGLVFADEYYDNVYNWDSASRVSVTAPATTPVDDLILEVGNTISGTITGLDPGQYIHINARSENGTSNIWEDDLEFWTGINGSGTDTDVFTINVLPGSFYIVDFSPSDSLFVYYKTGETYGTWDRNQATRIEVNGNVTGIDVNVQADTDGDSMPDDWETDYLDGLARDGNGDLDGDGLNDRDEFRNGTLPNNPDTDGDRISDSYEVNWGTDPTQASDAPPIPIIGVIINIHKPGGIIETSVEVLVEDGFVGTQPDDIDTMTITGPGLSLTKSDLEFLPEWDEWATYITGSPQLGTYAFTVTSGSASGNAYDTLTVNRTIPLADHTTFNPPDGATITSPAPTFSWSAVNYPETTMYYRLEIRDLSDVRAYASGRVAGMLSHSVPASKLNPGQQYKWRVRVGDSPTWEGEQNRSNSEWINFTMGAALPKNATPGLHIREYRSGTMTFTSNHEQPFTGLSHEVMVVDYDGIAADGSSHTVTVTYPNGGPTKTLNFNSRRDAHSAYYSFWDGTIAQPIPAAYDGDYVYRVEDPQGNSSQAIDNVVTNAIDPPDETTFTPNFTSAQHIEAYFDNVAVNGSLYDDFEAGYFDPAKWQWQPAEVSYVGGEARFERTWHPDSQSIGMNLKNPNGVTGFKANARVENITYDSTKGSVYARLAGRFCMDSRGEVHARVGIRGDEAVYTVYTEFWEGDHLIEIPLISSGYLGPVTKGNNYELTLDWNETTKTISFRVVGIHAGVPIDYPETYTVTDYAGPAPNPYRQLSIVGWVEVDSTTPIFNWAPVAGANHYRIRIYGWNDNSIYWGEAKSPPYALPPGVIKPGGIYKYRIYARRDHLWFEWDNAGGSDRDKAMFYVDYVEAQDPYIDLRLGAFTWNHQPPFEEYIHVNIRIHDAQGVPDNIESVTMTVPGGETVNLYYDEYKTPTEGVYRGSYFGAIPAGPSVYTFSVTDKDGNGDTETDTFTASTVAYRERSELLPLHNTLIGGTGVTLSWVPPAGATNYYVKVYDKDANRLFGVHTDESQLIIPPGILRENELYQYRLENWGEYPEDNLNNGSSSPPGGNWNASTFTTTAASGTANPTITLGNFGVAVWQAPHPVTGVPYYELNLACMVSDPDGVPQNIDRVEVKFPDGTVHQLKYNDSPNWGSNYVHYIELPDTSSILDQSKPGGGIYEFKVVDREGNEATVQDTLPDVNAATGVIDWVTNVTPVDGNVVTTTTPTITWTAVPDASYYKVRIMSAYDHPTVHWSGEVTDTQYTVPEGTLFNGATHGYRVYAYREPSGSEIDFFSCYSSWHAKNNHFTIDLADSDSDGVFDEDDNCPDDDNPLQEDSDSGGADGVGDVCDNCPADSNPDQENFDGDAFGDACDPDDDNDGLSDDDENFEYFTNPLLPDTDSDGLDDGDEVNIHNTNPTNPDSDDDGLTDGDEVNIHLTLPDNPDTDGDGVNDGDEIANGTDPTVPDAIDIIPGSYYVNPISGDNAFPGTSSAQAWRTLHFAVELINGGTPGTYTLNLAPGTYSFDSEGVDVPLVLNQDMIINGTGAILDGSGDHGDADNPWTTGLIIAQGAENVNINNLTITGFDTGIRTTSDGGCITMTYVSIQSCETGLKFVDSRQLEVEMDGNTEISGCTTAGVAFVAASANITLRNGGVVNNVADGIRIEDGNQAPESIRLENMTVSGNGGNGILILDGSGHQIYECTITTNNTTETAYGGVAVIDSCATLRRNEIRDNHCHGVFAGDALSSQHLDATYNYWGDADGPSGQGPGAAGDAVSEHVDFTFWFAAVPSTDTDGDGVADAADNCPANANAGQADNDGDDIGDVCDTDGDGDGYKSLAFGGNDCNDADAAIYPGAPEISGDGIDQDCDGADLPAALLPGTYYVDAISGSDDAAHGFSSGADAWKTIQYALMQMEAGVAGDYILRLAAGTYGAGLNGEAQQISINQNLTIFGSGSNSTFLDGTGAANWIKALIITPGAEQVTIQDLAIRNFKTGILINSDGSCVNLNNVSVESCETGLQLLDSYQVTLDLLNSQVTDNTTGLHVAAGSSNNVILNGIIRDNSGDGIRVGGDDEVPDENRFEGIQITDNGANGIIFYDGFNNLVKNCVISGNNNDETGQTGFAGVAVLTGNTKLVQNIIEANKCAGVYADEAASLEISGNLILGNKSEGIKLSFTTDVKIASNTITENQHGLVIEGGSSPDVLYNIIWDNIAKDLSGDGCTASLEYNDIGTRNLACLPFTSQMPASNMSFDPRFNDAAAGDCTLMSTSPCIDGTDFAEAGTDLAGYSRPKGNSWDIGAYESSGFADSDEDNLPDWWEQKIIDADAGDGFETAADVLPDDDFDGDGISNIDEYEAGTDPTTALEITIENPASSPFNTDSASITFSGTSANATQIVIRQNGTVVQTLSTDLDAWSVALSLAGGQNLISATAADGTHSITASVTVMQDYQNPQISVTNPEIQEVYETTSAAIVLSGLASDDTRVDSVTWSRTGWTNDLPVTISGAAAGTGSWTTAPIALVAGAANSITVTATDPWDKSASVVVEVIMVQGIASQEEALPEPLPPPAADPLDLDQDGYLNNDEDACGSDANDSDSIPANYGTTNGPAPNQYPTDESDALYDPNKVKRDANGDIIGAYLWPDCLNPDEDRDGMLDSCEEQIINADAQDGITAIADVLPGADFDQDGASNSAECQDGTDPTDAPAAEFMLRVLDVSNQAVYNSWLPGYQKVLKVQAQWQNGTAPATAVFSLQSTSKYPGRVENDPDPSATLTAYQPWYQYNGFDFGLTATDPATDQNIHSFAQGPIPVPGAGGIYTVYLQCWDYGARAKLVVTHPTNANIRSEVWIPKGAGANGISSNWIHDNAATRLQPNADIDAIIFENPGGYTAPPGDGFNNFAEYRGILYRATIGSELLHLRLNPRRKNLFVMAEGYDDAIGDPYRPFDPPVGDGGQPQYDSYYPFRLGTALKNAGVDVLNITGWGHDATEDGSFFTYYKQGSVQGFLVAKKLVTGTGTGWAAHWPKREWQFRMAADVNAPWMPITSWGSATQLSLAFSYQGPSTSGAYLIRKPLPHINAVIIRHDRTSPSALTGKDGIINFQTAIPPSALNPDGTRYWNWDQKGHANTNSTEDHPTMYGFATTYQVPLDHYFGDRPYVDGTVWTNTGWSQTVVVNNEVQKTPVYDGKLAPLSRVEDRLDTLTPMDGVLGDSPDNYWDGDYRSNDQSAWFMADNQVSPFDIDGNGYVELPFASDPGANNYSKQYDFDGIPNTRARVLRDTATHELVHAIAGPPHSQVLNCLMYEESSSWSKDNYISDYIRALLRVHNFTR